MPHNTPKKQPTLLRIILREHGEKINGPLLLRKTWWIVENIYIGSHPKLQSSRPTSQVLFLESTLREKKWNILEELWWNTHEDTPPEVFKAFAKWWLSSHPKTMGWFQIFFEFSPRNLGKWSTLTSMFFKWVAQTASKVSKKKHNQKSILKIIVPNVAWKCPTQRTIIFGENLQIHSGKSSSVFLGLDFAKKEAPLPSHKYQMATIATCLKQNYAAKKRGCCLFKIFDVFFGWCFTDRTAVQSPSNYHLGQANPRMLFIKCLRSN